jgi:hypothetical protein
MTDSDRMKALAADPTVRALVEAVIDAAANALLECSVWCDSQERTDASWHHGVIDARKHHMARIRALTPADAATALADMLREARNEGLEEAATKCADYGEWCKNWAEDCNYKTATIAADECAAAIRALKEPTE